MDEIAVSVICNAYNHEKYIKDALDGFIMQKTNFKFEILVHDDASTDNTANIIREYEKKYPELIKPIYQTENQYSKENGRVGRIQTARVKGKYIALCEGDDYWTDPYKLQKQYDALEKHKECDICSHKTAVIDSNTNAIIKYQSPENKNTVLSVDNVILGGGGYVATNSLMYRAILSRYDNQPEFRKMLSLDFTLQIHGSLRGGMLYLDDCMGVYRLNAINSWSTNMSANKSRYIYHIKCVNAMLKVLNCETNYIYNSSIQKKIYINNFTILKTKVKDIVFKFLKRK